MTERDGCSNITSYMHVGSPASHSSVLELPASSPTVHEYKQINPT